MLTEKKKKREASLVLEKQKYISDQRNKKKKNIKDNDINGGFPRGIKTIIVEKI